MAILKVARLGHPVLRQKATPIPVSEIGSPRIQQLIDDMFETMAEYAGIGLAAPQVHESVRLFVAGVRKAEVVTPMTDDTDMPFITLINPEIVPIGAETDAGWEGCLSIPDIRGRVTRPLSIRVRAHDRRGRRIELVASGLPARVIQHEHDHLDGVLFFDRMTTFETLTFMDEFRRYWARDADAEEDGAGEDAEGAEDPGQ
jgi:peptide deformylase